MSRHAGRAVLGLTTLGDVEAKLAVADSNRSDRPIDYSAAVRALLKDGSRSVRAVALYYAGEIGVHCDQQDLSLAMPEDSADSPGEPLRLQDRALAILRELYENSDAQSHMHRILDMDINSYLVNDILVKTDRSSMASSLELRCPLLDPKIVELAASMPIEHKLNARTGKIVLKEAGAEWLPRELFERPKQGFSIPLRSWLQGPLKEARDAAIQGAFAAEYFDGATLKKYAIQHDRGSRDRSEALWAVLILHRWYERWGRQG